ncbi:MAG: hypothetical protein EOO15_03680 [Chitinophagaceae bacterium]|nr:MAG: hypothetical protein EOO15_03680 [Chitinophagaceae bacterium]
MQLTPEQIDALFAFTRKRYVHWYDLQSELADHLASRIEEEWVKDPSLSFDAALGKVYKAFGIFGFAHIVQHKEAQLARSSRRLWWTSFRRYFGLPHIVGVIAALILTWQMAHALPAWINVVLMAAPYVYSEVRLIRLRRQQRKRARPLLLLELSPLRFSASFFFIQLASGIGNFSPGALVILGVLSLLCTLINIASVAAHLQVQAEAERLYPEAFSVAG